VSFLAQSQQVSAAELTTAAFAEISTPVFDLEALDPEFFAGIGRRRAEPSTSRGAGRRGNQMFTAVSIIP
jgi:hypothetical protein